MTYTDAAAPISLADAWTRYEKMRDDINANLSAAPKAEIDELCAMGDLVFTGPIRTRADALAKIKAAMEGFEAGWRLDRKDAAAIADAVMWLERN